MFNIPEKTIDDLATDRLYEIDAHAKNSVSAQKYSYEHAFDLLWSFEDPQKIFDKLLK
jgi:hypothetical protein